MLIPAVLRKDEILENFKKKYYTDEAILLGEIAGWLPDIKDEPDDNLVQYAIVRRENEFSDALYDKDDKLLGYLQYSIDWYTSCASDFTLCSLGSCNPVIAEDLYKELERLLHELKLHRLEWGMVGGNRVEKNYDRFCTKLGGSKHVLKDVFRDRKGKYRDLVLYEVINKEV